MGYSVVVVCFQLKLWLVLLDTVNGTRHKKKQYIVHAALKRNLCLAFDFRLTNTKPNQIKITRNIKYKFINK